MAFLRGAARRLPLFFEPVRSWADQLIRTLETAIGDLEALKQSRNSPIVLQSIPKADLPAPSRDGLLVFVPDDVGGEVPAYSAGGKWLRITDRAEVE